LTLPHVRNPEKYPDDDTPIKVARVLRFYAQESTIIWTRF